MANIRATAYIVENGGNLKANATVTVNDTAVIRNLKVVETENGLKVNMPSQRVRNGEYKDTVIPASKEAAAEIRAAVYEAYDKAVELQKNGIEQVKPELNPADIEVTVSGMKDSLGNNRSVAICDVKIAEMFIVKDVKIQEGGELGMKVVLPGEFDKNNQWHETVSVYDTVVRDAVLETYVAHEENKENISSYRE